MRRTFHSILMRLHSFLLKDRAVIAFSFAGFLIACFTGFKYNLIPDDAYISFRYARNLAEGLGMTYNPGERILGTPTPLYVFILGLGAHMGLAPLIISCFIHLIAFGSTLFILFKISRRIFSGIWWLWLGAVLLLNCTYFSFMGMETWFYTFMIYFTFWSFIKERPWGICLGSFFCAFIRPEGFLVGFILLPLVFYQYLVFPEDKRRNYCYPILSGLILTLLGLIVLTVYFGNWFPECMIVKREQTILHIAWKTYLRGFFEKYFYPSGFPTPLMLFMLGGLVLGMVFEKRLRPLLVWGIVYQTVFFLGKFSWHEWYEIPIIPWFLLCCIIFWRAVSNGAICLLKKKAAGIRILWVYVLVISLSFIVIIPVYKQTISRWFGLLTQARYPVRKTGYIQLTRWLSDHAPLDAEIAASEIGIIGYYAPQKIYDLIGTVSSEPRHLYRKIPLWEQIWQRGSQYCIYSFANLPGDFLSVPSKLFWRNYHIKDFRYNFNEEGVSEIAILFSKHSYGLGEASPLVGNISAPLRSNESGLVILDLAPHTALKGHINSGDRKGVSWTFAVDSRETKLEFTPSVLPPLKFNGICMIEERNVDGGWMEKSRFSINMGESIRYKHSSDQQHPVICITIFPEQFPDTQGFFLLDATASYLE